MWALIYNYRYISVEQYVHSARGKGKFLLLADGNGFQKFLRNVGFYVIARDPSIVQVKLGPDSYFELSGPVLLRECGYLLDLAGY